MRAFFARAGMADGERSYTTLPRQCRPWLLSPRRGGWSDRGSGEPHYVPEDGHDMRELLGPNGCKPIDERFQMPDGSYIVRKEITGLLSERFGDVDEILHVQPALFPLQSGEVCGRDGNGSRHIRL